jgi:BirA family transcriptional regulator, biotin operon repressor / biotin---[acetyl-CoA-carboxylase] ligase
VIETVTSTGSTNADLLARVRAGDAVDGTVLVTDHQTAGRGRQGRVWQDRPAGSLLVSVLVRAEPETAPLLPLAAGLAAVAAVGERTGLEVRLKWPNDVLVPAADERKLAGILAEAVTHGGVLWVVIGMGLNLRWPDDRPSELADRLVAVGDLVAPPTRDGLLETWLEHLDRRLVELTTSPSRQQFLADYRATCLSIGRAVRMATPAGEVEGTVADVADDGALLLRVDDEVRRLDAGDVHHL